MAGALAGIVGLGVAVPDPYFGTMFSTFALSVIAGYQSVWGVAHALHTPLMSVTNAISGITAVGGLLMLGGGYLPHTMSQLLASFAVFASAINITGGFIITNRMLNMFKRKSDPTEYNYLYGIPGVAGAGSLLAAHAAGVPNVYQMGYLFSSLLCIGGIAGLAQQKTARVACAMGMIGVGSGVVTALASLNLPAPVFAQALALLGSAGAIGAYTGAKVPITELPQTVAAFHALVGIAAVTTSLSSFMAHAPGAEHAVAATAAATASPIVHNVGSYLGAGIGAITFTGSIIAYLALSGKLPKNGYDLPAKTFINKPLYAMNMAGLIAMT